MSDWWATWGTPSGIAAICAVFGLFSTLLYRKFDDLKAQVEKGQNQAETIENSLENKIMDHQEASQINYDKIREAIADHRLHVAQSYVTRTEHQLEIGKIDAKLLEIGNDLKDVRNFLMTKK